MRRFHVHLGVNDLERSIGFYSNLFGAEPTVRKDDYAKWMLDDPRVNFAISRRGNATRVVRCVWVDGDCGTGGSEHMLRTGNRALRVDMLHLGDTRGGGLLLLTRLSFGDSTPCVPARIRPQRQSIRGERRQSDSGQRVQRQRAGGIDGKEGAQLVDRFADARGAHGCSSHCLAGASSKNADTLGYR